MRRSVLLLVLGVGLSFSGVEAQTGQPACYTCEPFYDEMTQETWFECMVIVDPLGATGYVKCDVNDEGYPGEGGQSCTQWEPCWVCDPNAQPGETYYCGNGGPVSQLTPDGSVYLALNSRSGEAAASQTALRLQRSCDGAIISRDYPRLERERLRALSASMVL